MMALAASMLPFTVAHGSREMDCVPTWTWTSVGHACRVRPIQVPVSCLPKFWLTVLRTKVEPLLSPRTGTLDVNLKPPEGHLGRVIRGHDAATPERSGHVWPKRSVKDLSRRDEVDRGEVADDDLGLAYKSTMMCMSLPDERKRVPSVT